MDKLTQILQLCLPRLAPKDVCMFRCTCHELLGMHVSWQDHSIVFQLDGSLSGVAWLHKNIKSMQKLDLRLNISYPRRMLQDVMKVGRCEQQQQQQHCEHGTAVAMVHVPSISEGPYKAVGQGCCHSPALFETR